MVTEEMSPDEAKAVFRRYGAKNPDIAPEKLRSTWIGLVQRYHPDRTGGSSEALSRINSAYDVLKNQGKAASGQAKEPTSRQPAWQTDDRSSYNGIAREDYTDLNWFKKRMWELSNQSKTKYTVWAFDGRHFRGTVTVFGSRDTYREMAHAMVHHITKGANSYHVEAVFVQEESHSDVIILVWQNGKDVRPPVPLEHESPNSNPSNDQIFMDMLPQTLAQIETGRDRLNSFPSVAAALGRYRTS